VPPVDAAADAGAACFSGSAVSLITTSWGDETVRITPNIHSLANNSTATPNEITGALTTLTAGEAEMNLTVDPTRGLAYVADDGLVKSFASILTASGNVAPAQTIAVAGSGAPFVASVSSDGTRDRLYAIGTTESGASEVANLWIFDGASTLSGTLTPSVTISFGTRETYTTLVLVDSTNDRLYVASGANPQTEDVIAVFDGASTLTAASTANRTITIEGASGDDAELTSFWVDACHDDLYITDRTGSSGGKNVFGFNHASTLNATLQMDTGSFVNVALGAAMNVIVDGTDALFAWSDSATSVQIFQGISSRSGTITADLTLEGVVNGGYGMASIAVP
jgi:hypothetical protein